MAGKSKRTVTIKSSGGVTRAVNGDVEPEPSRLRPDAGFSDRFQAARPPRPTASVLEALNEYRAMTGRPVILPTPAIRPRPVVEGPLSHSSRPSTPEITPSSDLRIPRPKNAIPPKRFGPFLFGYEKWDLPPVPALEEPMCRVFATFRMPSLQSGVPNPVSVYGGLTRCAVCKILPATFACLPCRHESSCFACAGTLKTCPRCKVGSEVFYRSRIILIA